MAVEEAEVYLRAKLAYLLPRPKIRSHRVSGCRQLQRQARHEVFRGKIENEIKNNGKALFVRHHMDAYEGRFPI